MPAHTEDQLTIEEEGVNRGLDVPVSLSDAAVAAAAADDTGDVGADCGRGDVPLSCVA